MKNRRTMVSIRWVFAVLLSSMWFHTYAQTATEDLKQMSEAYRLANQMTAEINYKVYLDNSVVPHQTEVGTIKMSEGNTYAKYFGTEVIANPEYVLVASHKNKFIMIDHYRKPESLGMMEPIGLDSLLTICSKVEAIEPYKEGVRGYRFELKRGKYRETKIYFDATTYLMTRFEGFTRKPMDVEGVMRHAHLVIDYDIKKMESISSSIFSSAKFVTKTNGKFALNNSFKGYRLLDNTLYSR